MNKKIFIIKRGLMKKYLLHQESGFLCDLYFVFYLKFNYQMVFQNNSNYNKALESTGLYKEIQLRFGEIPEDLYVFFHSIGMPNHTFLQHCYLKEYEHDFIKKYNIEYLQQDLADYDQVIKNVICFYFKGISDYELAECLNSKEVLFERIKSSKYSIEEKLKLYEFFVNPINYILLLRRTLTSKQSLLNEYYQERYKKIIDAYDPTVLDMLNERGANGGFGNIQDRRQGYVSYCLLDRLHFNFIPNVDDCLYILGDQYKYSMDMSENNSDSCLERFCSALCEKNRVDILNLLLKRNEVTCKELERIFDFSGSTAYHHISIMSKAGIVKTRNQGKVIFYSINRNFVNEVIDHLKNFN